MFQPLKISAIFRQLTFSCAIFLKIGRVGTDPCPISVPVRRALKCPLTTSRLGPFRAGDQLFFFDQEEMGVNERRLGQQKKTATVLFPPNYLLSVQSISVEMLIFCKCRPQKFKFLGWNPTNCKMAPNVFSSNVGSFEKIFKVTATS